MQVYYKIKQYLAKCQMTPVAMAIGKFEGVHLGHQHILKSIVQYANANNLTSIALIVEKPKVPKHRRIMALRDKLQALKPYVDVVIVVPLHEIKHLSPAEFITLLTEQCQCHYLIVGNDFKFGKNRSGNIDVLKQIKPQTLQLQVASEFYLGATSVHSSVVREALSRGKIDRVTQLLGRYHSLTAKVQRGAGMGHRLGYATANLRVAQDIILPRGVYAVWVIIAKQKLQAVCNIGVKPTLQNQEIPNMEIHIFDFNQDIYGIMLTAFFVAKIRNEKKFDSVQQLKNAIAKDCTTAKQILSNNNTINDTRL